MGQHVVLEGVEPVVRSQLPKAAGRRAAGVGDDDVGLWACLEQSFSGRFLGDVTGDGGDLHATLAGDLDRSCVERGVITPVDDEIDAFVGERVCACSSQASR